MAYKFLGRNIKEQRVLVTIQALYRALTDLTRLEVSARDLIDEEFEIQWIQELSNGVLPNFENGKVKDLVFRWADVNFATTSETKLIETGIVIKETDNPNAQIKVLDETVDSYYNQVPEYTDLNFAEIDSALFDNEGPDVFYIIDGIKIQEALVALKNIEKFDYDYESYGLLNELYRVALLILDALEEFYSHFYYQSYGQFIAANNDYDDSGSPDRMIYVYDTKEIDKDLEENVFPVIFDLSNDIPDNKREDLRIKYGELRDRILFFCMSLPPIRTNWDRDRLYNYIRRVGERRTGIFDQVKSIVDEMLFCINGLKKFGVNQYNTMRVQQFYYEPMSFEELTPGSSFLFVDQTRGTRMYVKIDEQFYQDNLELVYDFGEEDPATIMVQSSNDPKSKRRNIQLPEEVFFPYHNKTILLNITQSGNTTSKEAQREKVVTSKMLTPKFV
jgi:hypothetical protein